MKKFQQLQIFSASTNNCMTNLIKLVILFGCSIIIFGGSLLSTNTTLHIINNVDNISTIIFNIRVTNSTTFLLPPPPPPPAPLPPPPKRSPPPPSLAPLVETPLTLTAAPRLALLHKMEDEELVSKALSVLPKMNDTLLPPPPPKIAFMFLVRDALPLAPLWDKFFRGHQGFYSIYVHASPTFNHTYPPDSVFHGRRIPSKAVRWGDINMVEAERRLLANALLDPSNQRFVLHSETCIPLFDFPTVYSYLINSTKSFIQVYDEKGATGRGRYNHRMRPQIDLTQWRKGSQWFEMERELALQIISDQTYFPLFKKHCNNRCYGDEHYLPTYVAIKYWEKNSNRTVTWVDWSIIGPHPGKFERPRVTVELLKRLRSNYTCEYNGEITNVCYLFARKFMPSSLTRLLRFAPKVLKFG